MALLVVGSVALDSIETPFGVAPEVLGGSASYFSVAASFFTKVQMVGVVGSDFPGEHLDLFRSRGIDTSGLLKVEGETFRWHGRYGYDLNTAITIDTRLGAFSDFNPVLPDGYRDSKYVFLANIDPEIQMKVLDQVKRPTLVAADTMNFWIERKREALEEVVRRVDVVIINEAEAREFSQEVNLVTAARKIRELGPRLLLVKRGEYGVLMFTDGGIFSAPAYPLERVFDPTGAGDSFAGGFMGFLANARDHREENLRQAVVLGSVMASFCVEEFSLNRLWNLTRQDIERRYKEFQALTRFEDLKLD
mgnify:CR=1 FL=1